MGLPDLKASEVLPGEALVIEVGGGEVLGEIDIGSHKGRSSIGGVDVLELQQGGGV